MTKAYRESDLNATFWLRVDLNAIVSRSEDISHFPIVRLGPSRTELVLKAFYRYDFHDCLVGAQLSGMTPGC